MAQQQEQPKWAYEVFAEFFEQPTRSRLRELLKNNLGEFNHLDFKEQWLPKEARGKLARDILGFANSGGGVMVIGVKECADGPLSSVGIPKLMDKTDIHNSVKKFLPGDIDYDVLNFPFQESEYGAIKGKKFQALLVEDRPQHLPFISMADGDQIESGRVYVRSGTATPVATHEQLQKILNRRIETGHSTDRELTLKEHLDELKLLYACISPSSIPIDMITLVINPHYPKESYQAFIAQMIILKKKSIESFLQQRGDRTT